MILCFVGVLTSVHVQTKNQKYLPMAHADDLDTKTTLIGTNAICIPIAITLPVYKQSTKHIYGSFLLFRHS
jgi:uncharacterized membrane protein